MSDYIDYNNTEIKYSVVRNSKEVNVASVIKTQQDAMKSNPNDDSVEQSELSKTVAKLTTQMQAMMQREDNFANSISSMNSSLTGLSAGKQVITLDTLIESAETPPTTTVTLYNLLKTTLEKGDVCLGSIPLSDGPGGDTTYGILAYSTDDNITDGDSVYSRVYMIASSKSEAPYIWWYLGDGWRSIMLLQGYKHFTLQSSTTDSTKKFWISVDDSGTISATEIVGTTPEIS